MNRAPSNSSLYAAFPSVDPARLRLAREAWRTDAISEFIAKYAPKTHEWVQRCHNRPARRAIRRAAVDELIDNYGVEFLGTHKRTGLAVYYSNSGDPYSTTIVFHGGNAYLGCWGDLVEREEIKE